MKQMITLLFFSLAGTVLFSAQPPASNIRLIPGGIEVVERENAATAAFDPTFASAFDAQNSTYAGKGVALSRYIGSRGKNGTNDAGAEVMTYFTRLFDEAGVVWQTGEMGRVDLGGGGTIAKYVALHDIDTLDVGVPVLSMHSPFEITSKLDVYMAYKAFKAFNETAE